MAGVDARDGMAGKGLDTQGEAAGTQGSRGWTPKARRQGLTHGPEHSRRASGSILHKTKALGIKAPTLMPMRPTPKMHKDGLTRL